MTVEAINAYFTPLDYFLYLFTLFVIMVVYYQWQWTKTCRGYIQVLVVRADGSTDFELAPKTGGEVSLRDPENKNKTGRGWRTWPINKLSTITVLYPGVGFVPPFLQKRIQMVIVDEDDWEPIINRDPNKAMIASPAVLGNLMHEKISEAVITVNKEMMDSISGVVNRLNKMVSPLMFYIGIGVVLAVLIFLLYKVLPMASEIDAIRQGIGIP